MRTRAEAHYKDDHGNGPDEIETPEDVDRMIDHLLSGEEFRTAAKVVSTDRRTLPSGSPDHEFIIGVNPELRRGAISFGYEEGTYVTAGDLRDGCEPLYHVAGHEAYFPENCEIPLDLVRATVKQFVFSGGNRPDCVDWKPFDL
ncbi:Imm1 family immunity protein [Streptomyces sp. NPDC086147]|uniref:Imm1 family immunity protein n=1 Tax=Streptomyces sp. NPDC086147 TaxID=3155295 RepID=UPI00344E598A